jgi:hypothetical protein
MITETPWGPTTFIVKGDRSELSACAPASVMAPPAATPPTP